MDELTEREREVGSLIAEGRSNRGIGEALFVSPKTVEAHVRQIFMKLGPGGSNGPPSARARCACLPA
jgi:serine/threonine-protein kinase